MKITPNEIIYWEILPAIRSSMVFEMKEQGVSQVQIAQILGITPSAVSQYLKSKRGNFEFSEDFRSEIRNSVKKLTNKNSEAFAETNRLIKLFEKSKEICVVCNNKNSTSSGCNVCYE